MTESINVSPVVVAKLDGKPDIEVAAIADRQMGADVPARLRSRLREAILITADEFLDEFHLPRRRPTTRSL